MGPKLKATRGTIMRNNIIAFAGAHGIGKSRLALELANRLKKEKPFCEVSLIQEVARQWVKAPLDKNAIQQGIFGQQLADECRSVILASLVVSCRSLLDNLAYALASEKTGPTKWPWLDKAIPLAKELCKEYRLLIFLRPVGHKILDDGFRDTSPETQAEIDNILADLVADLPGVNIFIPDLSLGFESALDSIMERLR